MKIRHERKSGASVFTRARFEQLRENDADTRPEKARKEKPFYQFLFDQTKEEFEDALIFSENDQLKLGESSFLQIVQLLEKYNLSDTSDDVKGIAFEEFLGKTFAVDSASFSRRARRGFYRRKTLTRRKAN